MFVILRTRFALEHKGPDHVDYITAFIMPKCVYLQLDSSAYVHNVHYLKISCSDFLLNKKEDP